MARRNKCSKCGKNHGMETCPEKSKVCFNCQKPGHFSEDCSQLGIIPGLYNSKAKQDRSMPSNKSQLLEKKKRCRRCGKDHEVIVCPERIAVCFNCGEPGHFLQRLHPAKEYSRVKSTLSQPRLKQLDKKFWIVYNTRNTKGKEESEDLKQGSALVH